ncbi:hypothetical protein REG_1997 [Candidatus Regiella insecticola LSR1]|uniref:Uncharacterized protein n=1 Tax=Candidatus Regiella insecticola LSR1 TaxID=663321 RepID=E0WV82_9ENTR|nr:type 4b pilus protein PilO2 [Candidatus Regiella insecticola]EFL91086.1 hypothetical protein REG_1997 [Candidatus Regiella insecticola LSR1]
MSNEKKPIRLVTYNNKVFVVGLEWRAIKGGLHYMKEVKAIGKRENRDVVAIQQNDSIQAGFAPKFSVPLKGKYSLAVSLVSLIPGKWLAVIPLDKDDLNTDLHCDGVYRRFGDALDGQNRFASSIRARGCRYYIAFSQR